MTGLMDEWMFGLLDGNPIAHPSSIHQSIHPSIHPE
jgi:hypothetical protein